MESVEKLTPDMGGRWLVTTQGSTHLWDLDTMTYTRKPGRNSLSGSFSHDQEPMRLTRVDRWPAVGSTSFLRYDDPAAPMDLEHWRLSSTIVSIVRVDDRACSDINETAGETA